MNLLRAQLERFYRDLWDNRDTAAIPEVLHPDFTFRGSLGQEKRGHGGFAQYVDVVHEALGDYKCVIDDLLVESPKAFARMTFTGMHRAPFMGYSPTGKRISWVGAALFTFRENKIADVWVLGDLRGLEDRLKQNET